MKTKYTLGLCSAVALALASSASATTVDGVRFSLDGTTWTAATMDTDGDGVLQASFTGNGFNLKFVITDTFNDLGTAAAPQLDLGITGSTGVGSVWVEFSVQDFTPLPTGSFITSASGTVNGGAQTVTTRIGSTDVIFAPGTTLSTIGPLGGTAVGTGSGSDAGAPDPYSLTLGVQIDGTSSGSLISIDDSVKVPDGGNTLMLLGSALSVLGFGAFRKSRKA